MGPRVRSDIKPCFPSLLRVQGVGGGPLVRRFRLFVRPNARTASETATAITIASHGMPPKVPKGQLNPPGGRLDTWQYVPFTTPHVATSTASMLAPTSVPSVPPFRYGDRPERRKFPPATSTNFTSLRVPG